MRNKRIRQSCVVLVVIGLCVAGITQTALAQASPKYKAKVPESILR